MWGKDWRNGFKFPGNLYLACEADIHFCWTHTNGRYCINRGKRNSCLYVSKQLLTPVELWTHWEPRSTAAYRAVNQLQVLLLNDSVFRENSLEAATAPGISGFMRSRDSCWLLRSKCNCFSKQVVKTLSKTQVLRQHSVIYQLLYWFIEIITTNWTTTTALLAYCHLYSFPEG